MERYREIITVLEAGSLKYLLTQLTESIDHHIDSLIPMKKLQSIAEESELDEDDLQIFETISKHILIESTAKKDFEAGREILENLKVKEDKINVFLEVFQEKAQNLWNQLKEQMPATKNLVDGVNFSLFLPLHESYNSIIQEATLNNKTKFRYSDDVKSPFGEATFKIRSENNEPGKERKLTCKFDKASLHKLFIETEKIKEHLDKLFTTA